MNLPRQAGATAWAGADLSRAMGSWTLDARDYLSAEALVGSAPREVDLRLRRSGVTKSLASGMTGLARAVDVLVHGEGEPGVARIRGLPVAEMGDGRVVDLFAWLCRRFGRMLVQDIAGNRVYLVRAIVGSSDQQHGSHGLGELLFHTDQAAAPPALLPRVLGMCSLQRAERGGQTTLASGHHLVNALLEGDASLTEALRAPVWWGREEGRVSDRPPVRAPMARVRPDGRVDLRLNRYFAEVGARQTGVPMPPAVTEAVDAIDEVLAGPGIGLTFLLEAGDAVVVDNAVVLHNRSAYVDGPGHERCLARLWAR